MEKETASPMLCDECSKELPRRNSQTTRTALYPRIERIRMIANRVKHQSGYPKSQNDPLIAVLFEQESERPIRISVKEFLLDLAYVDAYLFLLTDLVDHAYHLAITKKVMEKPPTDGQESDRVKIEALAQRYSARLDADVQQYKERYIDKVNLVP